MGKIAKWRQLDKEQLEQIVKESYSDREVARKIGYSVDGGGTMKTLHAMYKELNLDTSHFKGQGWNKDNYDYDSFKKGVPKKNGKIAKPLIYLRGHKCEKCGLSEWLGQPITLEVHHIDGDHYNNELDNLQLLCPNCHSFTDNWRGKNQFKRQVSEEDFVKALQNNNTIHSALKEIGLTTASGNYVRANELIIKYNISHLQKSTQEETPNVNVG